MSRFRFVSDHADTYGVKRLCRVLHVSRSGYYDWRCRKPSARSAWTRSSDPDHRDPSAVADHLWGTPSPRRAPSPGPRCAKKRVARLMTEEGLVGAHARRKWRSGKPDVAPAPDLVNRSSRATPGRPGVGCRRHPVPHDEGWLHFAGVVDLYCRRVVGWAMGTSADGDLVIDALMMAFQRRRPDQG